MERKITYEIKGQQRRELMQAISKVLNTVAKYRSVPTCVYEIGDLVLDREGSIILSDSMAPAEIDRLPERFDRVKARLEAVTGEISDKQARNATIEAFLNEFKRLDAVTQFQPALWYSLADFMTVYDKDDVRGTFKDGTGIQA